MKDCIKLLDENLEYIKHEINNNLISIWVKSTRQEAKCPYCQQNASKVHSRYERSFQDLPIQDKKVIIFLENKKFFCTNNECTHKTFAETYSFLSHKQKKTKRLENKIIDLSMNVSSITASCLLNKNVAYVGKSTICNLLKKRRTNNS